MIIEDLINKNYNKLNENDLYVVKYILNNKTKCATMGINELALKCNVSKSTVLRLTQKLGLSGYSEFKIFLKWEEEKSEAPEEENYVESMIACVEDTIKYNKEEHILEICKIIHESQRIFVYGTGRAQQMCAEELKRLFLFSHKYFNVIQAAYELEELIPNLTDKDAIIIVSLSGNTTNLDNYTTRLNTRGTKVISITKSDNNKLASMSPYNIYGSIINRTLNSEVVHNSTLCFYFITELLFYYYEKYVKSLKV